MEIRLYENKDLNRVNYILKESFNLNKTNINSNEFIEIVCEYDGVVRGYLLITKILDPVKNGYKFYIDYVCVDSKYRNKKIGYNMLLFVEKIAKEQDIMYIELTSSKDKVAAHKLYEKCGFKKRESDIFRKCVI